MDLNAIMNSIVDFFTTDLGKMLAQAFRVIFDFLYPPNAEDAHEVPLPDTSPRR